MPVKNPEAEIKPGMKIGDLTVLDLAGKGRFGQVKWNVRCDCGQELIADDSALKTHNIRSCGKHDNKPDLTGQRFGMLTVIARAVNDPAGKAMWNFICDCGNEKTVRQEYLKKGTPNCGCYSKKLQTTNLVHGLNDHPLAVIWRAMLFRCENPKAHNYERYGGRGITVCERWHDLKNFVEDLEEGYAPGLQLDRIDNDGPYSPENCRWVTAKENNRNKRNNRFITTAFGTKTLSEQAEITGVSAATISERIEKGMPEVFSTIPNPRRKKLHPQEMKELFDGDKAVWLDDEVSKEMMQIAEKADIQAKAVDDFGIGPVDIILGDEEE